MWPNGSNSSERFRNHSRLTGTGSTVPVLRQGTGTDRPFWNY